MEADVQVENGIVDVLSSLGLFQKAYARFETFSEKGLKATKETYSTLLRGIKNMKNPDFEKAYAFLELYQKNFEEKDIGIYNSLLDVFVTF